MMDTGQNHQLGREPLRESCLETLNDFASQMEVATRKYVQLSLRQQIIWPASMTPIEWKHLYTCSETKSGSIDRTSL